MQTWWAGRRAHAVRQPHCAAVPALAIQAHGAAGAHANARRSKSRRSVATAAARTAPVEAAPRAKTAAAAAVRPLHVAVVQARWDVRALVLIGQQPVSCVPPAARETI